MSVIQTVRENKKGNSRTKNGQNKNQFMTVSLIKKHINKEKENTLLTEVAELLYELICQSKEINCPNKNDTLTPCEIRREIA